MISSPLIYPGLEKQRTSRGSVAPLRLRCGDQRPPWRLCLWLASPGSCLFPEPCLGLHCTADFLWDCERKTRFSCHVPYGFLSFPRPSEYSEPEAGTALWPIPVIVVQNSSPPGQMSRGSLGSLNAQLSRHTADTHSCTDEQM